MTNPKDFKNTTAFSGRVPTTNLLCISCATTCLNPQKDHVIKNLFSTVPGLNISCYSAVIVERLVLLFALTKRRGIYFWIFCVFFCFSWLLASVASGFCGFWLLWLLAFVAFGFRGFCGFWLFGLSIYLSIPIYLSIYLSFFLLAAVLLSLFVFAFPVVFVAETKPNKEASKQASTSCSPLDLVCCWGGAAPPPTPPAPRNLHFIPDTRACHEINILR